VIEATRAVLEEPLKELAEQQRTLAEAEEGSEARLAALRAERDEITVGRDRFIAEIPKRVYRRYERIRPQIHPAVVEMVDGVCVGCRIHIAPQLANQLLRGDDFHQCQQCQRFLYSKDALL